jgi:hypothetical protein
MENNSTITGTLTINELPFLRNYEELKPRLSIRLNNPTRVKPDILSQPFLNFLVTCHIDVSDVVGETAYCTVTEGLAKHLGVERAQLVAGAIENSRRTRPPLVMTIEEYMKRLGFPVAETETHLMIATTEKLFYGAGVVLYPGFLESISGGKDEQPELTAKFFSLAFTDSAFMKQAPPDRFLQ